ncbi:hypothetical protein FQZ97_834720 [compost metagenome]
MPTRLSMAWLAQPVCPSMPSSTNGWSTHVPWLKRLAISRLCFQYAELTPEMTITSSIRATPAWSWAMIHRSRSASGLTSSYRLARRLAKAPWIGWLWVSIMPGISTLPARSIRWVRASARALISASLPTLRILPSATATACTRA